MVIIYPHEKVNYKTKEMLCQIKINFKDNNVLDINKILFFFLFVLTRFNKLGLFWSKLYILKEIASFG